MGKEFSNLYRKKPITFSGLEHKDEFVKAVNDFLGEEGPVKTVDLTLIVALPKNLSASFIKRKNDHWNDPFFDYIYRNNEINDEERVILTNNTGKIIQLRRLKTTDEFKQAVNDEAQSNHQGALLLTHLRVSDDQRIIHAAANTIKYYYIGEGNDQITNTLKKVNNLSDQKELEYNIFLAVKEISTSESGFSLAMVPASLFLEIFLAMWGPVLGDGTSQFISQVAGEIAELLAAAGDRIVSGPEKIKMISQNVNILGIIGQTIKLMPKYLETYGKNIQEVISKNLLTIMLTTATTLLYTLLSQQTHSLLPYALIPTLNSLAIHLYEIHQRKEQFNNLNLTPEEREKLLTFLPKPLNKLKNRSSSGLLAVNDYYLNKVAVGNLLGAFAASLSVALVNYDIPLPVIYTLAGLLVQNVFALGAGYLQANNDPYKQFTDRLEAQ